MKDSAIFEGGSDSIDPQCVNNLDKQIEYIGGLNFLILTNEETF